MFSIGTLSGGILGGISSHYQISMFSQSLFVAILIVISNFFVRNSFLPATIDQHPLTKKKKIRRPKIFLVVGLLGLCAALSEGSAGDWGAVLARDSFDASPFISTLPYICFSAAMVIGRLMGDRLAVRLGPMKLIVGGGLIAGLVTVFKQLSPNTKIIGVEPTGAPSMLEALKNIIDENKLSPSQIRTPQI
jgi:MFS family permease